MVHFIITGKVFGQKKIHPPHPSPLGGHFPVFLGDFWCFKLQLRGARSGPFGVFQLLFLCLCHLWGILQGYIFLFGPIFIFGPGGGGKISGHNFLGKNFYCLFLRIERFWAKKIFFLKFYFTPWPLPLLTLRKKSKNFEFFLLLIFANWVILSKKKQKNKFPLWTTLALRNFQKKSKNIFFAFFFYFFFRIEWF